MKKRIRWLVCVLLIGLLGCEPYWDTLTENSYAYLGQTMPRNVCAERHFSEMAFVMPELAALFDRADALQAAARSDGDARALQSELDALYAAFSEAETMGSIAYVRYALDVTDPVMRRANDTLSVGLDALYAQLTEIALLLSERPELKRYYDDETVAALRAASLLYDPMLQEPFRREQELIARYDALPATFSIEYDGTEWTQERILNDETLSFFAWYGLYQAFTEALSGEQAKIYLELVRLRNGIAESLGFPDYTAYRYAVYERDYTPFESESFCAEVQAHLTPLYRDWYERSATDREVLYLHGTYAEDETMERIGDAICKTLPELMKPWAYMLRNGLYDCAASPDKLTGSFTTFFPAYGAPFLFTSWDDSAEMPPTILHEFGHFAGYWLRAQKGAASGSLDLAEVDSQGLELLAIPYYERIYGNRAAEARAVRLTDALYAILSGCAMELFEQFAYGTPDVTEEQLHERFSELCAAFALDLSGYSDTTWTQIPHAFRTPHYYISYATSASVSMELYLLSLRAPRRAARAYRAILSRDGGSRLRELLQNRYLTDPLEHGTISVLSEQMKSIRLDDIPFFAPQVHSQAAGRNGRRERTQNETTHFLIHCPFAARAADDRLLGGGG